MTMSLPAPCWVSATSAAVRPGEPVRGAAVLARHVDAGRQADNGGMVLLAEEERAADDARLLALPAGAQFGAGGAFGQGERGQQPSPATVR